MGAAKFAATQLINICRHLVLLLIRWQGSANEWTPDLTVFPADVLGQALDLSESPWDARGHAWTSDDYSACHEVAAAARAKSVEWIRYWSARDVAGHCDAVFEPHCLSAPELTLQQTWHC